MTKKVTPTKTKWILTETIIHYSPGDIVEVKGVRVMVISPLLYEFEHSGLLRTTYQVDNSGVIETYQDVELAPL